MILRLNNKNRGDRGDTRVTGVTGQKEEKKEKKENCRGRNGWTTSKALYEVLADLTRNWVGMNGPLIKAEKREKRNWVSMDYERSPH